MRDPGWLQAAGLRIGLGCMRLSTDPDHDDETALATIAAAVDAGITVFDTARSYGAGAEELGHNERLVARALHGRAEARIVTKGGMSREGGAWIPDGRAKTIRADCEASLTDLGGLPIDLYLVHAPDPRTPWSTSVRALARLADERLVRHVGLSNVNRHQLDEALELAPIAAVQVALNPYDDRAVRGGFVDRCAELGIALIAHSPLGGPRRAGRLARHPALAAVAEAQDATPAEVALAWLLSLSPVVVAIPGALEEALASGVRRIVLDNTYLTRAARSYVIETAGRHGVPSRCIWLGTPLAQAQVNLVERLLDRYGALPAPEELRELARREQGVLAPTSQMRAQRELEPPSTDEGFGAVERVPFTRTPCAGRPGVLVAATALRHPGWKRALAEGDPTAPHLLYDWSWNGTPELLETGAAELKAEISGAVDIALCPHPAGPPTCWCRPPLPGLPLAFRRTHGIDLSRSTLIGTGPAHRTLATTLGARYVAVE